MIGLLTFIIVGWAVIFGAIYMQSKRKHKELTREEKIKVIHKIFKRMDGKKARNKDNI